MTKMLTNIWNAVNEYLRQQQYVQRLNGFVARWNAGVLLIPPALVVTLPNGEKAFPRIVGAIPAEVGRFTLRLATVPGYVTVADIVSQATAIESTVGVQYLDAMPVAGSPNLVDLIFGRRRGFADLLPSSLDVSVHPATPDTWGVYAGWLADGTPFQLVPRERSGLLVSGAPGSGKTVLLKRLLRSWAAGGALIAVIDGKRGGDFASLTQYVKVVDGELESSVEMLTQVHEYMMRRYDAMKRLGITDFWEREPSKRPPLAVVVVDEAQTLLDATGATKEEKEQVARCTRLIRDLVKLGRAAGVVVVLATQKATADSIPTGLRDAMQIRVTGFQTTAEAYKAALGESVDPQLLPPPDAPGRMTVVGVGAQPMVFQTAPLPE